MQKITIINVKPGEQPPDGFIKMSRAVKRKYAKQMRKAQESIKENREE